MQQQTPPSDPSDPLAQYWNKPVSELTELDNSPISVEDAERHQILSLLAMAIVADAWNGNKRGQSGDYPWRPSQKIGASSYAGGRYLGHNIACIAVDARGEIIDFNFNHNEIFNSSAEHAEARLVRRIFNLTQNYDHWQTIDPTQVIDVPYANVLSAVTIYTTLESCAYCSGIMTLGNIKSVVFLQSDAGQYRIGNILYNLSNPCAISHPRTGREAGGVPVRQKYGAPEPVSAELFGFPYKAFLDQAYAAYVAEVKAPQKKYFWKSAVGTMDFSTSITSFLCTDLAKDIFDKAADNLWKFTVRFPRYLPPGTGTVPALDNAELLEEARRFRLHVAKAGHRGTPHE